MLPAAWFPRPWISLILLVIPATWIVRRVVTGRWSVRTRYDLAFGGLLLVLPLTLLAVVQWDASLPKLLTLLAGAGMVYALANSLRDRKRLMIAIYAVAVAYGGGLALAGLVGTDWLPSKFLPLDAVYSRLPRLVQGVTEAGALGGIHPNELGGALALIVPLTLALAVAALRGGIGWQWASRRMLVGFLVAVLLLEAGVLVSTQSRSAFAGVAAGVWIVGAWVVVGFGMRRRRFVPAAILFGFLTAVGVWGAAILVSNWAAASGGAGLQSLAGRLELWERGVWMLQDFPFTGIGAGQFELVVRALYPTLLVPASEHCPMSIIFHPNGPRFGAAGRRLHGPSGGRILPVDRASRIESDGFQNARDGGRVGRRYDGIPRLRSHGRDRDRRPGRPGPLARLGPGRRTGSRGNIGSGGRRRGRRLSRLKGVPLRAGLPRDGHLKDGRAHDRLRRPRLPSPRPASRGR